MPFRSTSSARSSAHSGSSSAIARNASAMRGSNHAPRRRSTILRAAARPSRTKNTSAAWASEAIRASSGIASPASPSGWPLPFHCSSSDRTADAASAGNASRSTIWAPRSQRAPTISPASLLSRGTTCRNRRARTSRGSPRATVGGGEPQRLERALPVDHLAEPFQLDVVGAKQHRHPCRARRAAGVLQKQGVEQCRSLLHGADRYRWPGAYPARRCARRVPAAGPRSDRGRARALR